MLKELLKTVPQTIMRYHMNSQLLSSPLSHAAGLFETRPFLNKLWQVMGGALFFAICSQISIPLYPVPMSLQTLFVFLFPLFLGRNKAVFSLLCYLAAATVGLPVLAGGIIEPLWFLGPRAGYLFSWPICAYLIGTIIEKKGTSSFQILFSFGLSLILIYGLGILFLCRFFPFGMSVKLGLLPFLPLGGLKVLIATFIGKGYFHIFMRKNHKHELN